MFDNLYKSVDMPIQPSLELINKTKVKMKEEINNSNKVVQVNFYKYATIAACFVIFIGILSVNMQNDVMTDVAPSINETVDDSYKESTNTNVSTKGNPFNQAYFNSSVESGSTSDVVLRNSILDNIADFFIGIAQWFKELLF